LEDDLKTVLFFLCLFVSISAWAGAGFPTSPDPRLTPGSLCHDPDKYVYPEHIPHCERAVSTKTKILVIKKYDRLGYGVGSMERNQFKIDHYIPLCAGGGNSPDNLWPQHESVYEITDPMDSLVCQKMARGKLKQAEAVQLIQTGKADLSRVPQIILYLMSR